MAFVDEDEVLVLRRQEQHVQVGGGGDALPKCLVALHRQLLRQNGGDLRLAQTCGTDQEAVVQSLPVLEGGIDATWSWSTTFRCPMMWASELGAASFRSCGIWYLLLRCLIPIQSNRHGRASYQDQYTCDPGVPGL